jgi:hypothetical protein
MAEDIKFQKEEWAGSPRFPLRFVQLIVFGHKKKKNKYSKLGKLEKMSIIANVTVFFLSILKMFRGVDPVTLGNALAKFQYLNDAQ